MGETFDRVAIALAPDSTEFVVLDAEVMIDFGQGQGPKGGTVTVRDGWVVVSGQGDLRLSAGTQDQAGTFPPSLTLRDETKREVVEIASFAPPQDSPSAASVYLEGDSAKLRMRDKAGNEHTLLEGGKGNLWLGGTAGDGDVMLFRFGESDNRSVSRATIHLDGDTATARLGGHNAVGQLSMGEFNFAAGQYREYVRLNAAQGSLHLRRPDPDPESAALGVVVNRIRLEGATADVHVGGNGAAGDIFVYPKSGTHSVRIDGEQGDIRLQNADCAEEFDVAPEMSIEPGTVVIVQNDGSVRPSSCPYDSRVAGVISGAGLYRPGLVLDAGLSDRSRVPVAVVGKVFCRVDAGAQPICVGDLLTTSELTGHAMKATIPSRAFGAVIGKALGSLREGTGLIPILVALQ